MVNSCLVSDIFHYYRFTYGNNICRIILRRETDSVSSLCMSGIVLLIAGLVYSTRTLYLGLKKDIVVET